MRISGRIAAGVLALALAGPAQAEWVASWTAPPHAPLGTEGPFAAASYENVTISQILRVTEGGERVRVRFSNRYGPAPLEIGAARIVQIDDAGREVTGTSRVLTFGGDAGAVIPRGAPFVSDEVAVALPDLARMKVEIFLPAATGPCTCHLTGVDELTVSPPGNFVGRPGIKVIGSPIGPYKGASYWSEEGEAARQALNRWILESGAFDALVRLDTAFADPADPARMREGYHMGDHLHGSDAGLKAAGESVDLALFQAD
jgi:hypothetical protein